MAASFSLFLFLFLVPIFVVAGNAAGLEQRHPTACNPLTNLLTPDQREATTLQPWSRSRVQQSDYHPITRYHPNASSTPFTYKNMVTTEPTFKPPETIMQRWLQGLMVRPHGRTRTCSGQGPAWTVVDAVRAWVSEAAFYNITWNTCLPLKMPTLHGGKRKLFLPKGASPSQINASIQSDRNISDGYLFWES